MSKVKAPRQGELLALLSKTVNLSDWADVQNDRDYL